MEDDLYYASHDIYGNSSLTGAIYLAAGNSGDLSDSYNLIYGHHMDNGAMFGSLDRFRDGEYFRNHQTGLLVAGKKIYDLTLFAVVNTDAYENQIYTVGNRAAEVKAFLTGDRGHDAGLGTDVVIYDSDIAENADKILALSTCASAETNGRLVVFARMTEHVIPEPEPKEVTLTVRYLVGNEKVFPDGTYKYKSGDSCYVVSPTLKGYAPEIRIVQGTITEDKLVIVRYVPLDYTLSVDYVFLDGSPAAPSHIQTLHIGDSYDVASPELEGFRALTLSIRGTNPGRDEQYTVVYVPEDADISGLQNMGDYETSLGLERVFTQVGICVE